MSRKFFPPILDESAEGKEEAEKLAKDMPDPPTKEPSEQGQPASKKPKVVAGNDEDEWETVEKTEFSATNGLEGESIDLTDKTRSTSIDKDDTMTQEEMEQQAAALHTAQTGGVPPQNALERDW